jgi:hypothetical protein
MAMPTFALGAADVRAGRSYRDGYQSWNINQMWAYERGRAWARMVPATVVLKRGGKITTAALQWVHVFKDII